jgi:hypothetical protein
LAIKSYGPTTIPAMVKLHCSSPPDPIELEDQFPSSLPVWGAFPEGDNPKDDCAELLRGTAWARPAERPVIHRDGRRGTGVDRSRGAVLGDGDQLLADSHELIGEPGTL